MPKDSDQTPEKKPKVLDLIETPKKPSRRERQREEASQVKTVDDAKRDALDLFAEEKKPKVRKTSRSGQTILPTISKVLDEDEAPAVAPAAEAPAPPSPPPATPAVVEQEEPDDPKLVIIKPPITRAAIWPRALGLKPFQVMADLIKMSVFVGAEPADRPGNRRESVRGPRLPLRT